MSAPFDRQLKSLRGPAQFSHYCQAVGAVKHTGSGSAGLRARRRPQGGADGGGALPSKTAGV